MAEITGFRSVGPYFPGLWNSSGLCILDPTQAEAYFPLFLGTWRTL